MPERQYHGFKFENLYIKENNLIKEENYTSPFDAYDNNGMSYQIKTIKKDSSIDLGDIFRNSEKDKDFFLVVSFWKDEKDNIVEVYKLFINHNEWNDYLKFDRYNELKDWIVNKVSNSHEYDIQWEKEMSYWKKEFGKRIIQIRFKRDHKNQRRIQCAINNKDFYSHFVKRYCVE